MSARIYIEGGGDSKQLHSRCREGFRRLVERCGLAGRMPRLVACGGRSATFGDFITAHRQSDSGTYIAMLIDSEDPVVDIERAWDHLEHRDAWTKPSNADDEQVLLMVTCMETWISVDRATLRAYFGADLRESALLPLPDAETRDRRLVCEALERATESCANAFRKGRPSFEILGKLNPAELRAHLPSFRRFERILNARLC